MSRDSQASFIHLKESHHVLYISDWVHDELEYDKIEGPGMNIDEENDSNDIQNTAFGASKRKKLQPPSWKDLNLNRFMNDEHGFVENVQDKTILTKLAVISNSLDHHGNTISPDNSIINDSRSDSNSSFNSSIINNSTSSIPNIEVTTPNVSRTTTSHSRNNIQNYQTPIGRIMR